MQCSFNVEVQNGIAMQCPNLNLKAALQCRNASFNFEIKNCTPVQCLSLNIKVALQSKLKTALQVAERGRERRRRDRCRVRQKLGASKRWSGRDGEERD
jgi:hypothetical protein